MTIDNRQELEHSYETLAKMIRLRDRCAVEPLWDPDTREDVVIGIENQMRKIEKQIADYLAAHPVQAA